MFNSMYVLCGTMNIYLYLIVSLIDSEIDNKIDSEIDSEIDSIIDSTIYNAIECCQEHIFYSCHQYIPTG